MKLVFRMFELPHSQKLCNLCGGIGYQRGETLECYNCHGTGMVFVDYLGRPYTSKYTHLITT